jgi:hypothetical protein
LIGLHGQLEFGPSCKKRLQRAHGFDAGKLMAKAEVNSGTE